MKSEEWIKQRISFLKEWGTESLKKEAYVKPIIEALEEILED